MVYICKFVVRMWTGGKLDKREGKKTYINDWHKLKIFQEEMLNIAMELEFLYFRFPSFLSLSLTICHITSTVLLCFCIYFFQTFFLNVLLYLQFFTRKALTWCEIIRWIKWCRSPKCFLVEIIRNQYHFTVYTNKFLYATYCRKFKTFNYCQSNEILQLKSMRV